MRKTDGQLDATSRRLLDEIEQLRQLELKKRQTARSSDEFHELAGRVDDAARHVFDTSSTQLIAGEKDSPLPSERSEQKPGDWTDGS
jgi:DNA anti-recombination protein RmuC